MKKEKLTTKHLVKFCQFYYAVYVQEFPSCCAITVIAELPENDENQTYKQFLLDNFFEQGYDCETQSFKARYDFQTSETVATIEKIVTDEIVRDALSRVFKVTLLLEKQSFAVRLFRKLKPANTFYFKSADGKRELVEFTFKTS